MCTFVMLDKGDATGRCSCLWSEDGDNLSLQYFLLPVEIVGYSPVMLNECVLKMKKHKHVFVNVSTFIEGCVTSVVMTWQKVYLLYFCAARCSYLYMLL